MAWMEQAWMVTAMITDFGNDFEHDRPRADLAIHGTILTHGVETYGTVVVRDGRIASVASDSNGPGANGRAPIDAVETIQLRNDEILIPGIVDTHVHINEPGRNRMGGFRMRHPGGRGRRRDHHIGHAAQFRSADAHRRGVAQQTVMRIA